MSVNMFQLMEGRKAVGGKVEVKIRIRDPYVSKQIEEMKEKWLVIDHFERQVPPAAAAQVNRLLSFLVCIVATIVCVWWFIKNIVIVVF